jgi:hypothetical protein
VSEDMEGHSGFQGLPPRGLVHQHVDRLVTVRCPSRGGRMGKFMGFSGLEPCVTIVTGARRGAGFLEEGGGRWPLSLALDSWKHSLLGTRCVSDEGFDCFK